MGQRQFIDEAMREADLLQTRALNDIQLTAMALTGRASLKIAPGDGESYKVYRQAILDGVRLVLGAEVRAFRGAGLFNRQLRQVLTDESLDAAANSFELSQIERQLLLRELNLYDPEFEFPEWLLISRGMADPTLSPYCRISRDGLSRLQESRLRAQEEVNSSDYSVVAQLSAKPEPADFQMRIVEFAQSCVLSFVRRFGPDVFEEWETVLKAEAPPPRLFSTLNKAVVQMALDYTRETHSLSRVLDWKSVYEPAVDYMAHLSDEIEQRVLQSGVRLGPHNSGRAYEAVLAAQRDGLMDISKSVGDPTSSPSESASKPKPADTMPMRMSPSIESHVAARRMESFAAKMGMKEFAARVNVTDRTLRNFRKSGRIKRDILDQIAAKMGISTDDLTRE